MVACQSCGNCIVSKLFETRAVCLLPFELARQELETSQSSWFKDLLALKRIAGDCFAQLGLMSSMVCGADQQDVRQRMNLRWGVMPFRLDFSANPEENVDTTFK